MNSVHSPLTASLRLLLLAIWFLALAPILILCRLIGKGQWVMAVGQLIYRGMVRVMGLKIEIIGQPCCSHPVLYVANHCSYFDIVVLGAMLNASFVAKKEVGDWPVIGPMARYAGTVFVERRARQSKNQRDELSARLDESHHSLILFPEGTSSNGQRVLPFKSALFSVAEIGGALPVQPISLAYTRLDGMPLGRCWRSHFSWYGDMELASHLWIALGLGRATVTVIFHQPLMLEPGVSRKILATQCERAVRMGVSAANGGRTEALVASLS